jgi:hypothetical protein
VVGGNHPTATIEKPVEKPAESKAAAAAAAAKPSPPTATETSPPANDSAAGSPPPAKLPAGNPNSPAANSNSPTANPNSPTGTGSASGTLLVPVAPAAKVEIKKAPPAPVDTAARMADPLAELELTDLPLGKVIDLLGQMGGLRITLDADAIQRRGVSPRDCVSLHVTGMALGDVLQAAVAQRNLAAVVDGGQVIVTLPADEREALHKVRYAVSDLTGDDQAPTAELAALVRKLVVPDSWQGAGGRGTIEPDRGALVVNHTGDAQRQVLVFLEKLRNARNKPRRSHDGLDRFSLATHRAKARSTLDRRVSLNFHEPAPLARVLAYLAQASDSVILVDHAALAAAETSDQVEASVTADRQPLAAVLADLLRPLGLTYRIVGRDVIQVLTTEGADERLDLEFYSIAPWLDQGVKPAALIARLKAKVGPTAWSDMGGPGEIYYDAPSHSLLVLHSQAAQAAIEQFLL